jgi:predicted TIM-barrel fold metal-dependent hydrolase
MTLSRRTWLGGTTAALAAGALADSLSAAEKDALPIVDTHQHLWDLTKFRLPWLGKDGELSRNFVTKDYLEAAAGLNIVKAVYMEVDVTEDQKDLEAEHLIALAKQPDQPTVAAVVGCRPSSPDFAAYAKRYRDNKVIKGFRQVLQSGKFDEQFVKNLQLLGELDKSFDLCLPAKEIGETIKVVDQCPDTRFILDHCGNADVKAFLPAKRRGDAEPSHDVAAWKRSIEQLAKRERVICKISGIIAGVPKEWSADDLAPIINHCLDAFGPKRVVFGSDWPVCLKGATLQQWVAALKEIIKSRPQAEQRQLLAENAIKFYRLG